MAPQFDFLSPTDKPAMLALTTPEWIEAATEALVAGGYKVQKAGDHDQFLSRFVQVPYQVLIIDELFAGSLPSENQSILALQKMPMAQRRHCTVLLLGSDFETMNSMQAFQQSVHAVVNYSEVPILGQIIPKIVADNDVFLRAFREIQQRIAQGKA